MQDPLLYKIVDGEHVIADPIELVPMDQSQKPEGAVISAHLVWHADGGFNWAVDNYLERVRYVGGADQPHPANVIEALTEKLSETITQTFPDE